MQRAALRHRALEPDGDVVKLARQYLPAPGQAAQAFVARLDARRRQIAAPWAAQPDLQRRSEYSRRWD